MAEENARWKIFVGVPDEEAESIAQEYPDFKKPIKQVYNYKGSKPTEEAVYNSMPWAADRGYKVMIQPDMETKADRALQSFEAFATAVPDTMTLGLTGLARRAAFGAMQDKPFLEGMKDVREYDKYLEEEHPWATGMGILGGIGASAALGSPLGAIGGAGKLASRAPAVLRPAVRGAGFVARGAAPGVIYKTADILSEGRVPTAGEELGAGGASLATDIALRGVGGAVSKIPGVNKIGPGIARMMNGKARPVAQRQVEGLNIASKSVGVPKDLLSSTVLASQPPVAPSGSTAPLYASMGRTTDTLLGTVKGSNSAAAASLAKRVKKDIIANDRALNSAIKKYQGGSRAGVGSPDNIAYRQRILNDEYAGLTEAMNTYDGKPLMLRVTKSSTPEGATRAEADLLNELSRMQASNEMTLGLSFDGETGMATPAAIMAAAGNITKNNSVYTAARAKAAQDAASDTIARNARFIGKGVDKKYVQGYFDDHRALFREADAFRDAQSAVANGRRDLGSFIGETPREIGNIEKLRGSSAAAKAQKGLVDARKAGIMSGYLKNLDVAASEGSIPPSVLPKDKPVRDLLNLSPEGKEVLRRLFMKDSLARSYSILTNPAVSQPTGAKGLLSRLVRAVVGKTGTYASQQLGLAGLEAGYRTMSKSDASKLASLLRMDSSKLEALLGQKTVAEVLQPAISAAAGVVGKRAKSADEALEKARRVLEKASGMKVDIRFEDENGGIR